MLLRTPGRIQVRLPNSHARLRRGRPASAGTQTEPARTPRSTCPARGFPRPTGVAGKGSRRCSGRPSNSGGSGQAPPRAPVRPSYGDSTAAGPGAHPRQAAPRRRAPSSPMGPQRPLPSAAAALLWGFLLRLVRGAGGRPLGPPRGGAGAGAPFPSSSPPPGLLPGLCPRPGGLLPFFLFYSPLRPITSFPSSRSFTYPPASHPTIPVL